MAKIPHPFKAGASESNGPSLWRKLRSLRTRLRLDHAAKQKACLTECGKTLTPDQQALKFGFGLIFEFLTLILGLIFIWFNAIFFFLKAESVELSFLKPNAAMWFTQKFEGQEADVRSVRIDYRKDQGALAFIAHDVSVISKTNDGMSIAHMEAEFDLSALVFGRFIPQDVSIDGGSVTIKRSENGDIAMGLGTPSSLGRLGPDITIDANGNDPKAKRDEKWRRIETARLSGADIFLIDEKEGLKWTLINVDADYHNSGQAIEGRLGTHLQSQDMTTPASASFSSSPDFSDWSARIDLEGVNPSKLFSDSGRLTALSALNANLDANLDIAVSRETGLRRLDIDVDTRQGVWKSASGPIAFKPSRLHAQYDADQNRITIDKLKIDTQWLKLTGTGLANPKASREGFSLDAPLSLDFALTDVFIDRGEAFEAPMEMPSVDIFGVIDLQARQFDVDNLDLNFGAYQANFSGRLLAQEDALAIKSVNVTGSANGAMTPQTVLFHWPKTLAAGPRSWVERAVTAADIDSLEFKTKFTAESLRRGYLTNDELSLVFPIRNATVRYIDTMTPLTQAIGFGSLYGNSFFMEVNDGQIGPGIDVEKSTVSIPKFVPKDDYLTVDINGVGGVSNVLSLINEPPFDYANRFGLLPEKYGGTGAFNFVYSRPVKSVYTQEETDFKVSATLQNVTTPIHLGEYRVEDGQLSLEIDKRGLSLGGPVKFGPVSAGLYVDNRFGETGGKTDYSVTGKLSRDDLDRLGIGFREYFAGDIDFEITAKGEALSVNKAAFSADLTNAELKFKNVWSKALGSPATLFANIEQMPNGGANLDGIRLNSQDLNVAGSAQFAKDLRLLALDFPSLQLGGFVDGRIKIAATQDQTLDVDLSGSFLNLSPWVGAALSFKSSEAPLPVTVNGEFSKLMLREDFEIENAKLGYLNSGDSVQEINLTGTHLHTAFAAKMSPNPDGESRRLFVEIPDTGTALKSFYGLNNVEGGKLIIEARLPPPGAPGPLVGEARVTDFQIRDIPVFARVLSLASLQGLGDALNGDGIKFQSLVAPFEYEDSVLTLGESRVSGAALGLTTSGSIDLEGRSLDLNGVIVPAYTLNSVLGNVPILGDIVVGKKGEGIFALNYSVDGPFEKTQVAVNPLSAFTPGFLRQIFQPVPAESKPKKAETESEP